MLTSGKMVMKRFIKLLQRKHMAITVYCAYPSSFSNKTSDCTLNLPGTINYSFNKSLSCDKVYLDVKNHLYITYLYNISVVSAEHHWHSWKLFVNNSVTVHLKSNALESMTIQIKYFFISKRSSFSFFFSYVRCTLLSLLLLFFGS